MFALNSSNGPTGVVDYYAAGRRLDRDIELVLASKQQEEEPKALKQLEAKGKREWPSSPEAKAHA